MGTIHRNFVGGGNHAITANPNTYVDIAARDADSDFNTDDNNENKVVRVESPLSFFILTSIAPTWIEITPVSSGGDVIGPPSSTDGVLVRFDGITGKLMQESPIIVTDSGVVAGIAQLGMPDVADPSSILDIQSTSKGVLHPRMLTVHRDAIASPAEGLGIYNLDTNAPEFYNGQWVKGEVYNLGFVRGELYSPRFMTGEIYHLGFQSGEEV